MKHKNRWSMTKIWSWGFHKVCPPLNPFPIKKIGDCADQNPHFHFLWDMGVVAGTLCRSPMAKSLSWTIYFYDFESNLFDRELFYQKALFLSGLVRSDVMPERLLPIRFVREKATRRISNQIRHAPRGTRANTLLWRARASLAR